ncbi:MAG: EscU/YscU/HrcU family type III secretion system export apparatus switch protein [Clostridiales bacterium]|jgi:flagellar biosynthesis protein|nr:EscU/YscU/HrcU family type III secretion system export apparatus switch protein [Clostridiales bacterium]
MKKAVALRYNPEEAAPKVIAKGAGNIAEKILENAASSGVPIHEDAALAESLEKIDLERYIPKELYEVVAQVLVYIDRLDRASVR